MLEGRRFGTVRGSLGISGSTRLSTFSFIRLDRLDRSLPSSLSASGLSRSRLLAPRSFTLRFALSRSLDLPELLLDSDEREEVSSLVLLPFLVSSPSFSLGRLSSLRSRLGDRSALAVAAGSSTSKVLSRAGGLKLPSVNGKLGKVIPNPGMRIPV